MAIHSSASLQDRQLRDVGLQELLHPQHSARGRLPEPVPGAGGDGRRRAAHALLRRLVPRRRRPPVDDEAAALGHAGWRVIYSNSVKNGYNKLTQCLSTLSLIHYHCALFSIFNFAGPLFAVPRETEPEGVGTARCHDQRGGAVGGAGGAGRGVGLPQGVVQLSGQ